MAEISTTSSYDYSSIGGFGSDASQSVNGTMINKIRAAEEASIIDPITEDIDNIALESEKLEEIKTKISELEDIASYFDLYNDENVFNQYLYDTSGTSAVYDAIDKTTLEEGTTSINITQLAQKDVYQGSIIASETASAPAGDFTVSLGGEVVFDSNDLEDIADISELTYEELATEINKKEGLNASVEQVGDSSYRLIVKSTETGTENALSFGGSVDLGFDTGDKQFNSNAISDLTSKPASGVITVGGTDFTFDGSQTISQMVTTINNDPDINATINENNEIEITMDDGSDVVMSSTVADISFNAENQNHTLHAQNLNASIDGVQYNKSSNSITIQNNLKITAVSLGDSSVTVSKDSSAVVVAAEALATAYNDLTTFINDEIDDTDSVIGDKSTLNTILADVKAMLFQSYGADEPEFGDLEDEYGDKILGHSNVTNNDKNIFVLGFSLDEYGALSVDSDVMNGIISGEDENYNFDDLKNVFTGSYENKGLGVQIKDYLDQLDSYNGLITSYETSMDTRKTDLEEDKEEEIERLDAKYQIMAEQFSAYSALIGQMESSFSGLEMMIAESTSSS